MDPHRNFRRKKMETQAVKVAQKLNAEEVPVEIIAQAIVDIGKGMKRLTASRLSERALVVLLKDACGSDVSIHSIEKVLRKLGDLERIYIKKQPN